jgi:xanthine/CO dehydrogenase XdhC/CoxF family maturation factor
VKTKDERMREILADVERWRSEGKAVAVATVVKVYGSAPRPLGAKMAVSESGEMVGSVSGGCVESAVVQEALAVIEEGAPKLVPFGISNESAWDVGLACGGTIEVYLERLDW